MNDALALETLRKGRKQARLSRLRSRNHKETVDHE